MASKIKNQLDRFARVLIERGEKMHVALMDTAQVSEFLGVSQSWLQHDRTAPEGERVGPQPVRVGRRTLFYRTIDIIAWLEGLDKAYRDKKREAA